jgi:LysM repeat protein
MHRIVVTLCALALAAGLSHAGVDNAGTTAGNFLSTGTGPGILSMGGAVLGSGGDLNAAAWNPAALAHLRSTEFAIAHGGLGEQQSQEWAAAGGRLGHLRTRWGVAGLHQGESGFEGTDAFGASTGTFSVSNLALGVMVAQPVGERFTVGLGAKYVSENLGAATGSAIAFDAGVQATAGAFGFGLAARNVGGSMRYDAGSYDLPSNVGVGVAWRHPENGLRLAADANFPSSYYNDVRLGAEWLWQDRVALRGGYRMELGAGAEDDLGGPAFGLGTGANGLWLDYGYLSGSGGAAAQHRLGLSFRPRTSAAAADDLAARSATPAREPDAAVPAPRGPRETPAAAPVTVPTRKDAARAPEPAPAAKPAARESAPAASAPPKRDERAGAPAVAEPAAAPVAIVLPDGIAEAPAVAPAPRSRAPKTAALAPSAKVRATPRAVPAEPVAEAPVAAIVAPPATVAPAPAKPAVVAPVAPAPRPATIVVKAGETLAEIAKRWDVSVPALMMENDLVSEKLKPGRTLKLPPAGRR